MTTIPDHCKAITYSRRGDPKNILQYEDHFPFSSSLEKDTVLVKIEAAGLNPVDWKLMKMLPSLRGSKIAAKDYAGTIIQTHDSVKSYKVGDKVYGQIEISEKMKNGAGTLVQYAICPVKTIAKRPDSLSAIDLGGITTVAQTALCMLEQFETVKNKENARVLVCGGSSSVGLMAIPTLKHKNAFVATTCSKAKFDVVSKRGADETFDCE